MSADQPGLGAQTLSKAAEIGLSSQLDQVEELTVDTQQVEFRLRGNDKFSLGATFYLRETGESKSQK